MIKKRRLNRPQDVKNLVQEQINILRLDESLDNIERAKAIGYLSNVVLNSMKQGQLEDKVNLIMENLDIKL